MLWRVLIAVVIVVLIGHRILCVLHAHGRSVIRSFTLALQEVMGMAWGMRIYGEYVAQLRGGSQRRRWVDFGKPTSLCVKESDFESDAPCYSGSALHRDKYYMGADRAHERWTGGQSEDHSQ